MNLTFTSAGGSQAHQPPARNLGLETFGRPFHARPHSRVRGAGEIPQLAEASEPRILTEEEFAAKKKQILGI